MEKSQPQGNASMQSHTMPAAEGLGGDGKTRSRFASILSIGEFTLKKSNASALS